MLYTIFDIHKAFLISELIARGYYFTLLRMFNIMINFHVYHPKITYNFFRYFYPFTTLKNKNKDHTEIKIHTKTNSDMI